MSLQSSVGAGVGQTMLPGRDGRALVCCIASWVGRIPACWESECGIPQSSAQAYSGPVHLGLPWKSHGSGEEGR